jgi:hypothetical protein
MRGVNAPTLLGALERANLNYSFSEPVIEAHKLDMPEDEGDMLIQNVG